MAHPENFEISRMVLETIMLPLHQRCFKKMVHTDVPESSCFALQANALPYKLNVDIKMEDR